MTETAKSIIYGVTLGITVIVIFCCWLIGIAFSFLW